MSILAVIGVVLLVSVFIITVFIIQYQNKDPYNDYNGRVQGALYSVSHDHGVVTAEKYLNNKKVLEDFCELCQFIETFTWCNRISTVKSELNKLMHEFDNNSTLIDEEIRTLINSILNEVATDIKKHHNYPESSKIRVDVMRIGFLDGYNRVLKHESEKGRQS